MSADSSGGSGTVRKHLYLITEHEDDSKIGKVMLMDRKDLWPDKNSEGDITIFDEDAEEYRDVGRKVCLGYHDFEGQHTIGDELPEVVDRKLSEIDAEWVEKAGIDTDGVTA
jgi:hypothetical protein